MLIAVLAAFLLAALIPWLVPVLGRTTGWTAAAVPVGIATYLGTFAPEVTEGETLRFASAWIPELGVRLSFALDGLSLLFGVLISGIGALVLIYTGSYLAGHRDIGRFFAWLLAFMASMLGLVLADNLILLFVFWELTSFTSYFLVGFDHERPEARAAALQALLVTGAGGLALLAGLILLGLAGGSFELSELLHRGESVRAHGLYQPALWLILLGAFTKSAQFPFHFWLPNAMAAPTPASAYLHSSTMVKAGVYLLARLSPVLGGTETWLVVVTVVGTVTMLAGAFLALRETYLKRVLAYSTISALGMLVLLLGIGTPLAVKGMTIVLIAHALYKAPLFLVAGAIDHETGERDLTKLGGLCRAMPMTTAAGVLAAASMAGVIPLLGFLAKELLFDAALHAPSWQTVLTVTAVLANVGIVAVAALVGLKPFFGTQAATKKQPHEAPAAMWLGPLVLAVLGLVLGVMPGTLATPVVAPVVAAVLGRETPVKLALWHGWTLPLALDAVAIAGGLAVYAGIHSVRRGFVRLSPVIDRGPNRGYELGLEGLNVVARAQTRVLQNGSLRVYLMTVLLTAVALLGYTLLGRMDPISLDLAPDGAYVHEAGLAALILLGAVATVRARSRLAAIAALGVVGYAMGLTFVVFGAPDLAITQFVIETLTVILFVLVFYRLRRFEEISTGWERARDSVIALAAGALMTVLVLVAISVQWHPPISDYFVENSAPLAHGRNIVNVILVDFRAMDTLGEITVLSVAAVGVYALLKLRPGHKEDGR